MTASALVATPNLIEVLLTRAGSQKPRRIAALIARGVRFLTLAVYALVVVLVILVAVGNPSQAGSVAVFFVIVFGFGEVVARQSRVILRDIALGGRVDQRFDKWVGPEGRWAIAGALFLTGTLIQLVGTFVE